MRVAHALLTNRVRASIRIDHRRFRSEAAARAALGSLRGVKHENFFLAKAYDSESVHASFSYALVFAELARRRHAHRMRFKKTAAAQAFSAFSANVGVEDSNTARIILRACRVFASRRELRSLAFARQHFFKREAVFFFVLVYSRCRASRFPSARNVEQPSH